MIEVELLYEFGGELREYEKNEIIFYEGQIPNYYYQIHEGSVMLNNYKDDGKEFIQNIFNNNQCFGESLLLFTKPYPMNAVSLKPSQIYQLPVSRFRELLSKHPDVSLRLNEILAQRLYYKYRMLLNLSSTNPEVRLLGVMDYLKSFKNYDIRHQPDVNKVEIPLTRQQLANLTGLCVETVIRTVKRMASDKQLELEGRKIYY